MIIVRRQNPKPSASIFVLIETTLLHYIDVIMGTMACQITSLTIVYPIVYSGAGQSKHQSFASLAFVGGIHRGPVNPPHKRPVTRKMLPFDDVIMKCLEISCYGNLPSGNADDTHGKRSNVNVSIHITIHADLSSMAYVSPGGFPAQVANCCCGKQLYCLNAREEKIQGSMPI